MWLACTCVTRNGLTTSRELYKKNNDINGQQVDRGHLMEEEAQNHDAEREAVKLDSSIIGNVQVSVVYHRDGGSP